MTGWRDSALCAQVDPGLWFPPPSDPWAATKAKQLCAACPYKAPCVVEAIEEESWSYGSYGIRGGMTPRERRVLARELGGAA